MTLAEAARVHQRELDALSDAIRTIARDGGLPVDEALKERNSRRRVSSLPPDPILEDEDFDRAVDNSNRMLFGD